MLRTWAVLVAAAAALLLLPRVQALDFDADEHLDEEVARAAFRIAVSADGVQYTKEVGSLVLTESMNRAWWDLTSDVLEAFREKKIGAWASRLPALRQQHVLPSLGHRLDKQGAPACSRPEAPADHLCRHCQRTQDFQQRVRILPALTHTFPGNRSSRGPAWLLLQCWVTCTCRLHCALCCSQHAVLWARAVARFSPVWPTTPRSTLARAPPFAASPPLSSGRSPPSSCT